MNEYGKNDSVFGRLVKWLVIGFLAIVALKVGLVILGVALRTSFFLLFTLGPIMLVGWLVWKLLRYFSGPPRPTVV